MSSDKTATVERTEETLTDGDLPAAVRGPARRLKSMVGVLAVVAILSFVALRMPWYHFSFSGDVVLPGTYEKVTGVSAEVDILGSDLAGLQIDAQPMQKQIPVGFGGLLLPHFWLLVGLAAAAVGAFTRNSFLAAIANLAYYFSYGGITTVHEAMENSAYGGAYNTPMPGISWFTLALFAAFAVTVAVGFQTVLVNRRERQERREAGEDVRPTVFETLGNLKMANFVRSLGAAATEIDNAREKAKKAKN